MSFKSILMIKHEDASKAGVKRVILKSKDWNGNHGLISNAIKSKWGLQLGEDCHTVIGECGVDGAKSLETAFSQLKDVNRVNVVVKDGALQSKMETMLIFGSKKIETSVADNITMSELRSLIDETFGIGDKIDDIQIYQIDNEDDTDNLDVTINENDDLEGAIEVAKDDSGKMYLLVKGPGGGSGGDDDSFEILINGEAADCKENINVTILKVTTEDANEAAEEWMANYEDVLSGIGEALEDDDWTKSYSLVDDEGDMEINTLEDFKDSIEATAEDNDGAPICFTLKSKSGSSGSGSTKKLFIFTANGSSITWEPEKDNNGKIKWGSQRVKLIRKLKKQFAIKDMKWSLDNDSSKVLASNTVEKLWNELESSKNESSFTFVLDGQGEPKASVKKSVKKSGLRTVRSGRDDSKGDSKDPEPEISEVKEDTRDEWEIKEEELRKEAQKQFAERALMEMKDDSQESQNEALAIMKYSADKGNAKALQALSTIIQTNRRVQKYAISTVTNIAAEWNQNGQLASTNYQPASNLELMVRDLLMTQSAMDVSIETISEIERWRPDNIKKGDTWDKITSTCLNIRKSALKVHEAKLKFFGLFLSLQNGMAKFISRVQRGASLTVASDPLTNAIDEIEGLALELNSRVTDMNNLIEQNMEDCLKGISGDKSLKDKFDTLRKIKEDKKKEENDYEEKVATAETARDQVVNDFTSKMLNISSKLFKDYETGKVVNDKTLRQKIYISEYKNEEELSLEKKMDQLNKEKETCQKNIDEFKNMAKDCENDLVNIKQKLKDKCAEIQSKSTVDVSDIDERIRQYGKEKQRLDRDAGNASNWRKELWTKTRTRGGRTVSRKDYYKDIWTGNKNRLIAASKRYSQLIKDLNAEKEERDRMHRARMQKQEDSAREWEQMAESDTKKMKENLQKQEKVWQDEMKTIDDKLNDLQTKKTEKEKYYQTKREELLTLHPKKLKAENVLANTILEKKERMSQLETELKEAEDALAAMRDKYKMSDAGLMEFFESVSQLQSTCHNTIAQSTTVKENLKIMANGLSSTKHKALTFAKAIQDERLMEYGKLNNPQLTKALTLNGFEFCRDLACDDKEEFDEFIVEKLNKEAEGFKDDFGSDKRLMKKLQTFCVKKPYKDIEKEHFHHVKQDLVKDLPSLNKFFTVYHGKSMIAMQILKEKKEFDDQAKLQFKRQQEALAMQAAQSSSVPIIEEAM